MAKEYVTQVEGVYRVEGTRVSLDSLVYLFREGMSEESIVESYPTLTLEQVHGALAFYLANQRQIATICPRGNARPRDHLSQLEGCRSPANRR